MPTVQDLTAVGVLTLVLLTGLRQDWVFGWLYRREVARADRYEDLWRRSMSVAEKMTDEVARRSGGRKQADS